MIIYHQSNVAGFAGAHTFWWPGQQLLQPERITVTTAPGLGQPFYIRDNYTMPSFLGMSQA